MNWYLYIVSLAMVALFATYILYPDGFRHRVHELIENVDPRFLAISPIVIGILLFISAAWARTAALVVILGILACLKGAYLLFAPREHVRVWMEWWFSRASLQTHRLLALIGYSLGLTLFYQIG